MRTPSITHFHLLAVACVALLFIAPGLPGSVSAADDPLGAAVEAARKSHDEKQLQSLKTQLEQKIAQSPEDAGRYLNLARVQEYFLDVYERRKDKKAAVEALDKGIDAVQRSIQLNTNRRMRSLICTAGRSHWGARCSQARSSARKSKKKTPRQWRWTTKIRVCGPVSAGNT